MATRLAQTNTVEAAPNQAYWDKALECFKEGEADTTAIQRVWQIMQPPASLQVLASIIGAIYADVYWSDTFLDPASLSASLRAAKGWKKADCDAAAQFAFSKWYGLLVRNNMSDYGQIPKTGMATASPDVVVNGAASLTVDQLVRAWNAYIYTAKPGLKNNTYGRAQSVNIQVPIEKPALRMFYSDAGFNTPPQSWIKLFTFTGSQESAPLQNIRDSSVLVAGDRAANAASFAFEPAGTGHYCLISVASSEYLTNDPLRISSGNWDSNRFIHYNGAVGWHNLDVQTARQETLKFYNQDDSTERFRFEAHCYKLPEGSRVALTCADDGMPGAASGPVAVGGEYSVASVDAEVPGGFAGNLSVNIDTPGGGLLPEGSWVDVRMSWILPAGHQHHVEALEQVGALHTASLSQPAVLAMGNYVLLGSPQ